MKVIGITGGVGSGKSTVLELIKNNFNAYIIMTDEVAKITMEKGEDGFNQVVDMFGSDIIDVNGEINRNRLAKIIFNNPNKRIVLNSIIHPLVKSIVLNKINELKIAGTYDYVFVEAALLIEDHYNTICDELWYIYVPEEKRRVRLKDSRGYSDDKITSIFNSQLSDADFRESCNAVIDNGNSLDDTLSQLVKLM